MERIRFVICGLLLALGLSLCPVPALAADGFIGGLEDFANVREVEKPEGIEEKEEGEIVEEVRSGGTETTDAEQLTLIRGFINGLKLEMNGTTYWPKTSYHIAIRVVLLLVIPFAVLLVFMWWGVRKSIRIIFKAFRKGSASL